MVVPPQFKKDYADTIAAFIEYVPLPETVRPAIRIAAGDAPVSGMALVSRSAETRSPLGVHYEGRLVRGDLNGDC